MAVEAVANRHSATMILGSSARGRRPRAAHRDGPARTDTSTASSWSRPVAITATWSRSVDSASTSSSSIARRSGSTPTPSSWTTSAGRDRATRHLLDLGHRRIGFVGDSRDADHRPGATGRLSDGARRSRRGRSIRRSSGSAPRGPNRLRSRPDSSWPATTRRPRSSPRTTAPVSGSIRAIALRSTDRSALVGFDDFELADLLAAPVTVVGLRPRRARAGRRGAAVRTDGR